MIKIIGKMRKIIQICESTSASHVFGDFWNLTALCDDGSVWVIDGICDFKGYPIAINDVQSVFNFSAEYEQMIEDSVNKDVAVRNKERETRIAMEEAKAQQVRAEAEAKIRITQAEAEAKQRTLQADAEAHAIKVKGQAEADSAKALAEALAKNQDLVALKTAEKWNGVLPTYIPQGTVMPFVQLPQK